jgi:type IV secretion system protein VirB11
MRRVDAPEITDALLERLAAQIARSTHQGVNRENPLLAGTLPNGERIQMIGPPVTRRHWAMAIRRHVAVDAKLADFANGPLGPAAAEPVGPDAVSDPVGFLEAAVAARKTILISGGTSSGKTTFLNALLRLAPQSERIVTVEDTAEVRITHPNAVGLVAVKGALGEANVGVEDLLEAALRMRPDRIIVGEVRGREAATFLRAVNTGHPGSVTTVHANTPDGALEQLALMVLQTGMPLSRADTRAYCSSVIDVIVQLTRSHGRRRISAIHQLNA